MKRSQFPKIFYGLHFTEGVCQYIDPNINDGKPHRILIRNEVIREMDPTFQGRPVVVQHTDGDATPDGENDGYVIRSFYNEYDGRHWVEFMAISDDAIEKLEKGWKLSNSYFIEAHKGSGTWHDVDYLIEVVKASYDHLAIVETPKYEESIVLTPDQFKAYNESKKMELLKVANSKTNKGESMLKFFKKAKVDNSSELEDISVRLPKSDILANAFGKV